MAHVATLEGWFNSLDPELVSFLEFYVEAQKFPSVFEAPVRHVSCHGQDAYEYILVHCSVTLPASHQPIGACFRLEHNPTGDIVRMHKDPSFLYQKGSLALGGYFIPNLAEDTPKTLVFKHILEIYWHLAIQSSKHDIGGPRFSFGFSGCLQWCKPCFGGQWFECAMEPVAIRLIDEGFLTDVTYYNDTYLYLFENHSGCCLPNFLKPGTRRNTTPRDHRTSYGALPGQWTDTTPEVFGILQPVFPRKAPKLFGQLKTLSHPSAIRDSLPSVISGTSYATSMRQNSVWLRSISLSSLRPISMGFLGDADTRSLSRWIGQGLGVLDQRPMALRDS
ncbi:hypothetical protein FRC12_018134 [Ceratobasidium sp. 428]|nr:hypothetical protein FRC12_018134 [Ceratobasidium sp. 428]